MTCEKLCQSACRIASTHVHKASKNVHAHDDAHEDPKDPGGDVEEEWEEDDNQDEEQEKMDVRLRESLAGHALGAGQALQGAPRLGQPLGERHDAHHGHGSQLLLPVLLLLLGPVLTTRPPRVELASKQRDSIARRRLSHTRTRRWMRAATDTPDAAFVISGRAFLDPCGGALSNRVSGLWRVSMCRVVVWMPARFWI